ncbi:2-oxoglutarate dehydrogenase E1 component [Myxococcota bacterium]|nr:2-oxoglutarate dehydrogenase E1 component [Myxococcota bacterium]
MPIPEGPLNGANLAFVESLFAAYLADPANVSPDWQAYFSSLDGSRDIAFGPRRSAPGLFDRRRGTAGPQAAPWPASTPSDAGTDVAAQQDKVDQLVRAYRVRGHMLANLDPLGLPRPPHPELELDFYQLGEADLDRSFSSRTIAGAGSHMTLREILDLLRTTYCGSLGVQFMHIDDLEIKTWLQTEMERTRNHTTLTREQQLRILTKLTDAEIFEHFLANKFVGAKRFSAEGGESMIPLLDLAIEVAGEHGVREIVIGMAHRGRLNVLANTMGKSPAQIFREFADADPDLHFGRGDVKYHMGYSSDHVTRTGRTVHLSLCFNPSHLEFVNPVAIGRVRAKQDRNGDRERRQVVPFLIHGDAAFAGQGIVQETLNMSELAGYRVGGTIHLIVNNQIGFTTPPESSRSTPYASDVAKMLQVPIFHVNGEHPEAVARTIMLAMDFRDRYQKDVIIDMWCYRRHGHNEADDPAFTQPLMYAAIRKRKSVREGYLENLLKLGGVTRAEADDIAVRRREHLEHALSEAKSPEYAYKTDFGRGVWQGHVGGLERDTPEPETAVPGAALQMLLRVQTDLPSGFTPHPKIAKFLETRREMAEGARPLDWGAGEALAFGSLLAEGVPVRLSGQDSGRGTFSHRHAVLHDARTGERDIPLTRLGRGTFEVIDSPLSECGVLGFEYGYSLDRPEGLTLWEAQFGDFVNGAQVIIDQFIVSSEDKWRRLTGVTLLLPHGFEGQGPEHSSARLERFLGLCAQDNVRVVNLTTPAQLFHCLRRQALWKLRKPMIVMTPKSLLRHPEVVSSLDELSVGRFRPIIPDVGPRDPGAVRRVLLCSGKIYYDLAAAREAMGAHHVAIVRVEQLYPLRSSDLEAALAPYPSGTPVLWVQEEPRNMGAWPFIRLAVGEALFGRHPFSGITRNESASPATGSAASHKMEQELLLEKAFDIA